MKSITGSDQYVVQIGSAPILSQIGGPYPGDSDIFPLAGLRDALGLIWNRQMDPMARSPLDLVLINAGKEALKAYLAPHGWVLRYKINSGLRTLQSNISDIVETAISEEIHDPDFFSLDRISLITHFSEILYCAFLTEAVGTVPETHILFKARNLILSGYIIADLTEFEPRKLAIY